MSGITLNSNTDSTNLSVPKLHDNGQIMNVKSRRLWVRSGCGAMWEALQLHLNCMQWLTYIGWKDICYRETDQGEGNMDH